MSIAFSCPCGFHIKAPDAMAGKRGRCPQCKQSVTVPSPQALPAARSADDAPDLFDLAPPPPAPPQALDDDGGIPFADVPPPPPFRPSSLSPGTRPAASTRSVKPTKTSRPPLPVLTDAKTAGIKRHLYWVLLLVLLPLCWSTLHKSDADDQTFADRFKDTVHAHPEVRAKLETLSDDATKHQLFDTLPDDRLDGALLPERTWTHWIFAAVSAAGFLAAVLLLFPSGHAKLTHLLGTGLLTGTIGILLLLAFQWLAFHMPLFRGRGWITLLLDFIWLIGQSYRMALGDHGFVLSFLGFTAGVGFCEEACKALPLIVIAAGRGFSSWRTALLWGLVSGIGFGVSEGITYSTDYYNGVSGADAYVVRFVSCVGLHGIWAAAVGIAVFRRQEYFRKVGHPAEWLLYTLDVVIVPMVLHGLYDTLLKQNHDGYALLVAVASFGWLAYQIEKSERRHAGPDKVYGLAAT